MLNCEQLIFIVYLRDTLYNTFLILTLDAGIHI